MNSITLTPVQTSLEEYFAPYRKNIIGYDSYFESVDGRKKILYCDWTASGRIYGPIEERIIKDIAPFVANTHTETNYTGSFMTNAYHEALQIIKQHVNANANDVIISSGSGMTGVINKLQRILGFRIHEKYKDQVNIKDMDRPVIFCTHMEHHSNQTSWLETIAELVLIGADKEGLVDLNSLEMLLSKYKDRKIKIAAVTSCSNVTGIKTPFHEMAAIMHKNNGLCFVDFACSAPYININMHPKDPLQALDAIYFSPHKFLGGPGTTGILIFNGKLYNNR
ncbi:MAG TPA: aminotransferase class V-fold PLP-dependent enzyme, partial [Saprospiraceae bacterium]|nr:aminotransferase class V-fold PLP-dependent enzyme [Saprospiraceae bacterium]